MSDRFKAQYLYAEPDSTSVSPTGSMATPGEKKSKTDLLTYANPWGWSAEIDPYHREQAMAEGLYDSDPDLRQYSSGLYTFMQERPVIYPDMVTHYRDQIFGGSELPITVEEYVRRKADVLSDYYQRTGVEVDPAMLMQQMHGILRGQPADQYPMAAQYADDVLRTLQRGSASFQHPMDMAVTQEQFDSAGQAVAEGGRFSPEHAVPPELQRYFATQAVYDYMRAMQDGTHAPPYANTMSNVSAAVGAPFDLTGATADQFMDMSFRQPLAGRASQALYWSGQADKALPPTRFTPSVRPDAWRIGADPIREEQRQKAAEMQRAMAFRDAGGNLLPGGNAMYPHWSTANMTGAFGDGTYGGAAFGADHPYGRQNSQYYRNFAEFSRSPIVGAVEPTETHARGIMYPARTDADMDYHMNRVMPIVPTGMTREQFGDFYNWRQGDEAKGESFAETTYPSVQAAVGIPQDQRTWGPQWYTTMYKAPQNALGDLSYAGMTAATAGYGALSGGARGFAQGMARAGAQMGKAAGAGALAYDTGAGLLRGLGRGTMGSAIETIDDLPTDYLSEQGIGYGASGDDSVLSFLGRVPEENALMPNSKPTDNIRDLVTARNDALQSREDEYRSRIDQWNQIRGNDVPEKGQPRYGFRPTSQWNRPNWYVGPPRQ